MAKLKDELKTNRKADGPSEFFGVDIDSYEDEIDELHEYIHDITEEVDGGTQINKVKALKKAIEIMPDEVTVEEAMWWGFVVSDLIHHSHKVAQEEQTKRMLSELKDTLLSELGGEKKKEKKPAKDMASRLMELFEED